MRSMGKVTLALAGAFLFVALVSGQQEGGKGGKGGKGRGQGGFGGGFGGNDPISLLNNESVKKELGVTEEQTAKLPDAIHKALGDVLDSKQLKRLREIELQQRGTAAFTDPRVQKELKISEDQIKSVKTILDDSRKQIADAREDLKGDFQGLREKMQAVAKETTEKIQEVLTAEQRRAWKQMLGDEFKIVRPGIGDFFKKGKKTDLE